MIQPETLTSSSNDVTRLEISQRQNFDFKRTWGPEPHHPSVLSYPKQIFNGLIIVAGPCSIEDPEQVETLGNELIKHGITWMRGGVFRAGTYPHESFGLQRDLLERYYGIAKYIGLKIVIEVLDLRDLDYLNQFADAFQVGARHMQDYVLLTELSRTNKAVLLKRNMGATLDEFLGAAEYLCKGRCRPILVERGSSSFLNHVRWELSVSTIAAIKRLCALPIIVDASHGTGRRDLVESLTLAGIASGADGFIVEVHPDPIKSISDADQAISINQFQSLLEKAKAVRKAVS